MRKTRKLCGWKSRNVWKFMNFLSEIDLFGNFKFV